MASSASNASRSFGAGNPDSSSVSSGIAAPARASAEIIAVTTRDDFLLDLGECVGGQAAVTPVDSIAAALDQFSGARRTQLIAVDARDVEDLRGDVESAESSVPFATLLIFAPAEVEKQVAAAVRGSNVFAVLPLPIDRRKTAAVLEGALAEAANRRANAGDFGTARVETSTFSNVDLDSDEPEGPSRKPLLLGAIAAAVVVAGAGGYWFFTQQDAAPTSSRPSTVQTAPTATEPVAEETSEAEPTPAAPAEVALVAGTLDELLEKARIAIRERRYFEPANDSALLYYRSALAVDPSNAEAMDGMARVATLLFTRFDEAMAQSDYDGASRALASLKQAVPGDARLPPLEQRVIQAQMNAALTDGNLDRAAALIRQAQTSGVIPADQLNKWRTEVTRRQDEAKLQRVLGLFADRLREGRLNDAGGNNAEDFLRQARELAPNSAAVARAQRELAAAYLRRARDAAIANRSQEADRWIADARAAGASNADINAMQREVNAARQRAASAEAERLAQLARDRIRENRLTEPANDSAAYYLTELRNNDASNAAIASVSRDLVNKLIERATVAAREGRTPQMEADLAAARRWGADAAQIQGVQQIASARRAATTPTAPTPASAPSTPPVRLKRTRYVPPEFPSRALEMGVSGTLTVAFTVDVNGVPRDVRVVEANPANIKDVFDNAAISAVRRWRFEPVVINNTPTEVPVQMSINFEQPR